MDAILDIPLAATPHDMSELPENSVQRRLTELAERSRGVNVSIFMPLSPDGHRRQDRIRLRNLLRRAEQALRERGVDPAERFDVVGRLHTAAVDSLGYDAYASRGRAVFAGAGGEVAVPLPEPLPDLVAVGQRYLVGPLLSTMSLPGRAFVLALSGEDVRLFQVTATGISEVALAALPLGPLATAPPRRRRDLNAFVADRGGAGSRAVFHGSSDPDADMSARVLRYFRQVDAAVRQMLRREGAPLILAGVGYTQTLYRQVSSYPGLLADGIPGAIRDLPMATIQRRAWELAMPVLLRPAHEAVARWRDLRGTGLTIEGRASVAEAAAHGRVDTLLLTGAGSTWRPDHYVGVVDPDDPGDPTAQLDAAVVDTVKNGGLVYAVPAEVAPELCTAAVLRY